ncbi:MAG: T9SS type A sorting domain-containing protein [Chitinophagales bacterium]
MQSQDGHLQLQNSNLLLSSTVEGDVSQSWIEQVSADIETGSYNILALGNDQFKVGNNAHGLQAYITSDAMCLEGTNGFTDWSAKLQLKSISAGVQNVTIGNLIGTETNENNLAYRFDNLTVEYINTKEGLRQNFIVNNAPDDSKELSVNLSINTDLSLHVNDNELILTKNGSYLYKYKDLKVWDKNGKILPASMGLKSDDLLALQVDITDAVFPVTIDPLSTTYAWKVTGGQLNANLGFWICGDGDLNGDGYDDVAVGAPKYTNTENAEGAVFVYYGSASGLSTTPSWAKYGLQDSSDFGRCVSIEGDLNNDGYDDLVVGAPAYNNPSNNEGKAWVYLGSASGLNSTSIWTYESNRKSAKFGDAVSIVDDTNGDGFDDLLIGAHAWDDDEVLGAVDPQLGNKAGKFWLFHGNTSGVSATAHMECVGLATDANLGVSVDGAGDVNGDGYNDIQVGGYIFLIGDGMICTFHGGPAGCDNIPDFMAVGGAEDTSFYAVNLSQAGDINGDGYTDVLIGMPRFDTDGVPNSGKMRYHFGGPAGMDTVKYDLFGEGQYDQRWAFNVNDAGDLNKDGYDDILLTAKHYSPTGALGDSVGRGYLYLGSPQGLSPQPYWTFDGESVSGVGTNIASAGDVNGDGLIDIMLSGDGYSGSYNSEGAAYVFNGIEQVCDPPTAFAVPGVGGTSATFTWDWVYGSYMYKLYIKRIGVPGPPIVVSTETNSITVTGLVPGATYKCYVKSKCQAGWTSRSNFKTIYTPLSPEKNQETYKEVSVFPNPVQDVLNINFGSQTGQLDVSILDASGKLVLSSTYTIEGTNQTIQMYEVSNLSKGIYFIQVSDGTSVTTKKITKSN